MGIRCHVIRQSPRGDRYVAYCNEACTASIVSRRNDAMLNELRQSDFAQRNVIARAALIDCGGMIRKTKIVYILWQEPCYEFCRVVGSRRSGFPYPNFRR